MDFPDKNIIIFLNCNKLQPILAFSHTLICTEANVYSQMPTEAGQKSIFNLLLSVAPAPLVTICVLAKSFSLPVAGIGRMDKGSRWGA